jgi:hypothetical protein
MISRLVRRLIFAATVAFVCVIGVSSRVANAAYMSAGDQLTNGTCLSSGPNGTNSLCYEQLDNGWYGAGWSVYFPECSSWSTQYDATWYSGCPEGYGSHSNQSASAGSGGFLNMQSDGNLVLYNASSQYVWATFTNVCSSNCYFSAQDDGNLVLYYNWTSPLWSLFGDNS